MLSYIARRLAMAVFTIIAISMLSFAIIKLPPGDYVDAYVAQMSASGSQISQEAAANLQQLLAVTSSASAGGEAGKP